MCSRVKEIKIAMDAIVAEYMNNPDAQLMDLMSQGETFCKGAGLGGKAVIHSSKTITHHRNRGGGVLDVQSVPELVANNSDASFSWEEVAGAAAVRLPAHGAKARRECEIKNEEVAMQAQGALAPVIRDAAEIAVISCSHNTAGMAAANAGAKCGIERISDGQGNYSVPKIVERCPSYERPLNAGLTYFVYDWAIEEHFSAYIDLVIEGSNIGSALARADSFIELAQKAVKLSTSSKDWDAVAAKLLRAKPALASHVPEICKYVEHWAGEGNPPKYLTSLAEYLKTVKKVFGGNSRRRLSEK